MPKPKRKRNLFEHKLHILKAAITPIRPTRLCALVNMTYTVFKTCIDNLEQLQLVTIYPPDTRWYWVQTTPDGIEVVKLYEALLERLGEDIAVTQRIIYQLNPYTYK